MVTVAVVIGIPKLVVGVGSPMVSAEIAAPPMVSAGIVAPPIVVAFYFQIVAAGGFDGQTVAVGCFDGPVVAIVAIDSPIVEKLVEVDCPKLVTVSFEVIHHKGLHSFGQLLADTCPNLAIELRSCIQLVVVVHSF
jgi:hypothetical protein